jgi:hypothetical protein
VKYSCRKNNNIEIF